MVCTCRSHRSPGTSKRLMVFVQRRLGASGESFGRGIAVLFTERLQQINMGRGSGECSCAPTLGTPAWNLGGSSGVNREARDFPQTKSTFRSFFLLKFPSNLQLQPSSLQHQPQYSTSITITSCSGTRCCDRLPPHPLTSYFFVLYTTHTPVATLSHACCRSWGHPFANRRPDPQLQHSSINFLLPAHQLPPSVASRGLLKLPQGLIPISLWLRRRRRFKLLHLPWKPHNPTV